MQINKLQFSVPITEKSANQQGGDYKIAGVAINATTTRNGTRFLAQELENSASTLQNRPILKDHNNSVDSIVGKTTSARFDKNQGNGAVVFEGVIKDPAMQAKIDQGLIEAVSIGATVQDLKPVFNEESGEIEAFEALGITFVELSLVAVPADPNAGFAKACMEAYNLQATGGSVTNTTSTILMNGVPNTYSSASTISRSPSKTEREEASMADDKTATEKLLAEKARLEEENATLQLEATQRENSRLKAAKEAAEKLAAEEAAKVAAAAKTATELKGEADTTEKAKPAAQKMEGFDVQRMNGNRLSFSASSFDGVEGLSRLKRGA